MNIRSIELAVDNGEAERVLAEANLSGLIHLASYPGTPAQIVETLTQSDMEAVRVSVAGRKNLPVELIRALSLEPGATRNTQVQLLATQDSITNDVLSGLANKDTGVKVLTLIAQRENLPDDVYRFLLSKKDDHVWGALVRNETIPIWVATALSQTRQHWFNIPLVNNPGVPVEVVEAIAADKQNGSVQLADVILKRLRGTTKYAGMPEE